MPPWRSKEHIALFLTSCIYLFVLAFSLDILSSSFYIYCMFQFTVFLPSKFWFISGFCLPCVIVSGWIDNSIMTMLLEGLWASDADVVKLGSGPHFELPGPAVSP